MINLGLFWILWMCKVFVQYTWIVAFSYYKYRYMNCGVFLLQIYEWTRFSCWGNICMGVFIKPQLQSVPNFYLSYVAFPWRPVDDFRWVFKRHKRLTSSICSSGDAGMRVDNLFPSLWCRNLSIKYICTLYYGRSLFWRGMSNVIVLFLTLSVYK